MYYCIIEIKITQENFDKAQKDFVPVSLKGVKLQKSETEWKDIGGKFHILILINLY